MIIQFVGTFRCLLGVNRESLLSGQTKRVCVLAFLELQRQETHADQVRSVNALERFGTHKPDILEKRALRRPVPTRAAPVLLAGEDAGLLLVVFVRHSRIENVHLLATRNVYRAGTRF